MLGAILVAVLGGVVLNAFGCPGDVMRVADFLGVGMIPTVLIVVVAGGMIVGGSFALVGALLGAALEARKRG